MKKTYLKPVLKTKSPIKYGDLPLCLNNRTSAVKTNAYASFP